MSCHTKEQLEQMLEDVVNELDLGELAQHTHGQMGTTPAELVKQVLEHKNQTIARLRASFIPIRYEVTPR